MPSFTFDDDGEYHECIDCGEEADELWDGTEWLCLDCIMNREEGTGR